MVRYILGFRLIVLVGILWIGSLSLLAQEDADQDFCAEFLALEQTALEICADSDTGTVCLGSESISAVLNNHVQNFQHTGDMLSVTNFDVIKASPLAPNSGTWGIAIFNIRADLPDDSTENIQLVLYGGVELTLPRLAEIPSDYHAPMQAFNLRATHESACTGMPPGVLINVPDGYHANFIINGLRIVADSQIFIGLPPDNSYLSISRSGTSNGQIVWGNNHISLSDDVAVVLVPMTSITPSVMVTPGGVIPTVTQEASYNTRSLEPVFVYVAVGTIDQQANTYFLQWEVRNALGNVVEFVVDGKSDWESAPATQFYQVIEVAPNAKAINLVLRADTALGYVYRGIDFLLPLNSIIFHYFD